MIYFDNAATTYPKPDVVYDTLDKANREFAFNSGRGSYKVAQNASDMISETRELVASLVGGAKKDDVVFTTSATHSLNAIIFGIDWNDGDIVYISPFEHNSIIRPLEEIRSRYNIKIVQIPFDKKTWDVCDELNDLFVMEKPKCIFCSAKSNVVGYRLPFEKIFELGRKYNSINVLDASQSFGVDTLSMKDVDFMVFAGHKSLYASFGIAGFIKNDSAKLRPWIFGGTGSDSLNSSMPEPTPNAYEAGSMNIVAICGLNASVKWLKTVDIKHKEGVLLEYFVEHIKDNSKITLYLPDDIKKCSGIISFNVDGYTPDEVGEILSDNDICVRTGYHCAPLVHDFIGSKDFFGTVRVSFNNFNTFEEIDMLNEVLNSL